VLGFNASNSIYDIEIDKINRPKKPSSKGTIDKNSMWALSIIFYTIGLLLATYNFYIFLLAMIFIFINLIYSIPPIRLKKRFLGDNFTGGLVYGIIPIAVGYVIFINNLTQISIPVFMYFFFSVAILSTIKDFEDYSGDKKHGIKTLPVIYGPYNASKIISISFLVVTASFSVYSFISGLVKLFVASTIVMILGIIFSLLLIRKVSQGVENFSDKKTAHQSFTTRIFFGLGLVMEIVYALVYII
jgi:4-hydroxybenzoate polyprenyltransferase